ncbi:MAG: hypothetical protein GC171_16700 [Terrimonas sp.]|nr:hypothetical protein [Terrimonas sp.]
MADNTEEKHPEHPVNTQPENPPEVTTPTANTATVHQNEATEKMEVHHHPDLHHKTKKWKEYFLEFFMIFLAVTMGFIAENIREHFTERKIARQNLEAYRNDLLQQEKQYTDDLNGLKKAVPLYDSIVSILYSNNENKELSVLSRLLFEGQRNIVIAINTPTYEQLISSGSMRFIENKDIKDSIAHYKNKIDFLTNYNDRMISTINNQLGEFGKIIDMHDFWTTRKNIRGYTPEMQSFNLNQEQRKFLIAYYKVYSIQVIALTMQLKNLLNSNITLTKMIEKELNE